MVKTRKPGVQAQGDGGGQPKGYYAACENDGCGVCGPIRATEGAAHDDAREHAKVCSSRREETP